MAGHDLAEHRCPRIIVAQDRAFDLPRVDPFFDQDLVSYWKAKSIASASSAVSP